MPPFLGLLNGLIDLAGGLAVFLGQGGNRCPPAQPAIFYQLTKFSQHRFAAGRANDDKFCYMTNICDDCKLPSRLREA